MLAATGDDGRAFDLACSVLPEANVPTALAVVEQLASRLDQRGRARAAIESALLRHPEPSPWRHQILRVLVRATAREDRRTALTTAAELTDHSVDLDELIDQLRADGLRIDAQDLTAMLPPDAAAERVARLRHLQRRLSTDDDEALTTLAGHLARVFALCRTHAAHPVLLTYPGGPFARPSLHAALRRVAAEQAVDLLDIGAQFVAEGDHGASRVAADGHCNDLGYRAMAEAAAAHAARVLAKR